MWNRAVACVCLAAMLIPSWAGAALCEDALSKDSAFSRAQRYMKEQKEGDLEFKDELALQAILVGMNRVADSNDTGVIETAARALNEDLKGRSILKLGRRVLQEEIAPTSEKIFSVILLKNRKPWRKLYLGWEKLSPQARGQIGIQDRHKPWLSDEATHRVFLAKLIAPGVGPVGVGRLLEEILDQGPRLLEPEEMRALFLEMHTTPHGERKLNIRDCLVQCNEGLVRKALKTFTASGMNREMVRDLEQACFMGLVIAVDRYDPHRDEQFSTYAMWWIRHGMFREHQNHGRTIRLPIHVQEKMAQMDLARGKLLKETGEEPSPHEIAQALGWTQADILALASAPETLALDAPLGDSDDLDVMGTMEQTTMPSPQARLEEKEEVQDTQRRARSLLSCLPIEQRLIMKLFWGIGTKNGQKYDGPQIGKILGISKERVRQIKKEATRRLRWWRNRTRPKSLALMTDNREIFLAEEFGINPLGMRSAFLDEDIKANEKSDLLLRLYRMPLGELEKRIAHLAELGIAKRKTFDWLSLIVLDPETIEDRLKTLRLGKTIRAGGSDVRIDLGEAATSPTLLLVQPEVLFARYETLTQGVYVTPRNNMLRIHGAGIEAYRQRRWVPFQQEGYEIQDGKIVRRSQGKMVLLKWFGVRRPEIRAGCLATKSETFLRNILSLRKGRWIVWNGHRRFARVSNIRHHWNIGTYDPKTIFKKIALLEQGVYMSSDCRMFSTDKDNQMFQLRPNGWVPIQSASLRVLNDEIQRLDIETRSFRKMRHVHFPRAEHHPELLTFSTQTLFRRMVALVHGLGVNINGDQILLRVERPQSHPNLVRYTPETIVRNVRACFAGVWMSSNHTIMQIRNGKLRQYDGSHWVNGASPDHRVKEAAVEERVAGRWRPMQQLRLQNILGYPELWTNKPETLFLKAAQLIKGRTVTVGNTTRHIAISKPLTVPRILQLNVGHVLDNMHACLEGFFLAEDFSVLRPRGAALEQYHADKKRWSRLPEDRTRCVEGRPEEKVEGRWQTMAGRHVRFERIPLLFHARDPSEIFSKIAALEKGRTVTIRGAQVHKRVLASERWASLLVTLSVDTVFARIQALEEGEKIHGHLYRVENPEDQRIYLTQDTHEVFQKMAAMDRLVREKGLTVSYRKDKGVKLVNTGLILVASKTLQDNLDLLNDVEYGGRHLKIGHTAIVGMGTAKLRTNLELFKREGIADVLLKHPRILNGSTERLTFKIGFLKKHGVKITGDVLRASVKIYDELQRHGIPPKAKHFAMSVAAFQNILPRLIEEVAKAAGQLAEQSL